MLLFGYFSFYYCRLSCVKKQIYDIKIFRVPDYMQFPVPYSSIFKALTECEPI